MIPLIRTICCFLVLSWVGGCASNSVKSRCGTPSQSVVPPMAREGKAWKVLEERYTAHVAGLLVGAGIGAAAGALVGAGAGAGYGEASTAARISALRQKAGSPIEFHNLLKKEVHDEIGLLDDLGELRPVYDPDGYRYVTLLLYQEDVRQRGEAILSIIIKSSIIERDQQPSDRRRGFVLFETPFKRHSPIA